EFAGVLGHEIGHIAARHSVIQQRNALLGQLGLIAGLVIAPNLAQFAETASQGLQLLFLKFGRDDERETDALGVEYSSKIGYDAQQMANFFNTLQRKQGEASAELPDFLSTHPNPGDRNVSVGKMAAEWKQKLNLSDPDVNRNAYLRRIEGLIYGEDPKQGFVENNVFYHPVLKIQFQLPAKWPYQNSPQAFQLMQPDGNALIMMTFAQGATLKDAANSVLQQYSLELIESKETTVNGLKAITMVADQKAEQNSQQQAAATVRTLSYIIQYGGNMYLLIGATSVNDFNKYASTFTSTMQSFKELRDAAKLNKQAERIRIKTVSRNATLEQALKSFNVPEKRLEEMAVLNGMKLKDQVNDGTLIKVIGN
ncbi:MAG TPA: M48 family metalloprotease, partial [Chitinophagaceae bacterium]|nr:M48 family metalloprotease [Chitinophagaceae bacterium]